MYSHCRNCGWILGHRIDGTQAEYVRIGLRGHDMEPARARLDPCRENY